MYLRTWDFGEVSQKNVISLEPYFSLAQRVVNPGGGVTMGMVVEADVQVCL